MSSTVYRPSCQHRGPWLHLNADTTLIAAIIGVDALLLINTPWSVAWRSEIPIGIGLAVLLIVYAIYRWQRPTPALSGLAADALRFVVFTNAACILSYILTGLSPFPLHDALLDRTDLLLGFDWTAYRQWVGAHGWLSATLSIAYASAGPQLVFLILFCALRRHRQAANELYRGFAWSALAVICVGALLPASGAAYLHHWVHATDEPVHQYLALRTGHLHVIDLSRVQGLVWFPSFHSALACLYVWVVRRTRWLLWPLLGLNAILLASCPIDGGHYLVDLIGGAIIAVVTLAVIAHIDREQHRQRLNAPTRVCADPPCADTGRPDTRRT